MKKKFRFNFSDRSKDNLIEFDFNDNADEKFGVEILDGEIYIYGNQDAFIALAKILIKMGMCDYKEGFHVHLREDFDGDKEEVLCIALNK